MEMTSEKMHRSQTAIPLLRNNTGYTGASDKSSIRLASLEGKVSAIKTKLEQLKKTASTNTPTKNPHKNPPKRENLLKILSSKKKSQPNPFRWDDKSEEPSFSSPPPLRRSGSDASVSSSATDLAHYRQSPTKILNHKLKLNRFQEELNDLRSKSVEIPRSDQTDLKSENSKLRSLLRENLQEQDKLHDMLDQLRTELLARAGKIHKLSLLQDSTIPELESVILFKDKEIQALKMKIARNTPPETLHANTQTTDPTKPKDSQQQQLRSLGLSHFSEFVAHPTIQPVFDDSESQRLSLLNEQLEASVNAVLVKTSKSVASGIVELKPKNIQHFLCVYAKHVELFKEPDDDTPIFRFETKSVRVTADKETLDMRIFDGNSGMFFVLALNKRADKFEKWATVMKALKISVDLM
jgi:hypothetical protein